MALARRMLGSQSPEAVLDAGGIQPVIQGSHLAAFRKSLQNITVKDELLAYVVDIVRGTREHESVLVGAGPRGTQALLAAARATAAMAARDYVTPDDVRDMAAPALQHRLILRPEYEIEGLTVEEVIARILQGITVPR